MLFRSRPLPSIVWRYSPVNTLSPPRWRAWRPVNPPSPTSNHLGGFCPHLPHLSRGAGTGHRAHGAGGAGDPGEGRGRPQGGHGGGDPARWPVSRVLSPLRRDGHPSRPSIARRLQRSTRRSQRCAGPRRTRRRHPPIRPCSRQSLPRFTPPLAEARGGLVSVALVRASRRTGVTRCLAPWSPDFPRRRPRAPTRPSGHLAGRGV